ncbi:hypothetical protein OAP11_03030 [Bacteroidia bacterium]|nr:hypothetical protein [Bacteroidia bacterium]
MVVLNDQDSQPYFVGYYINKWTIFTQTFKYEGRLGTKDRFNCMVNPGVINLLLSFNHHR